MDWIRVKDKLPDEPCMVLGLNINFNLQIYYEVSFQRGIFSCFDPFYRKLYPVELTHYCIIDFDSISKDIDELD